MKIGYLGPEATFSHEAVQNLFPEEEMIAFDSITEIFEALGKNRLNKAVLPIENSTGGSVAITVDELIENNFFIVGEYFLKIQQSLLSKSSFAGIQKIYSHPQGFLQCKNWLKKNAKGRRFIETSSTAKAAELASQDEFSGAIASKSAAKIFKLNILFEEINDKNSNETRFIIISKKQAPPRDKTKTTFIFGTKNKPGALYNILGVFKKHSVNMTKLESRPLRNKDWEYIFFTDIEGNISEKHIKNVIKDIDKHATTIKILGSYSRIEIINEKK
jgi:chorismate mutase / prephenate dehydratase